MTALAKYREEYVDFLGIRPKREMLSQTTEDDKTRQIDIMITTYDLHVQIAVMI